MSGDWDPNELLGTQLGSCVLERTLGVGGMGAVYLAQQIRPRRQVAVKVLQPSRSTSPQAWHVFLERFRREADIAAGLDHANIVPIYEFGEDGDVAFLVMPYLPDGSLADLLLRAGQLPLADALTYVEQIAAALDYAHARGLVHRDVKPSNLLLHPDGRLLLADFGIACTADATVSDTGAGARSLGVASLTQANIPTTSEASSTRGLPAGTPEYMAPEQVRGGALSPATDIYALGIVAYAMLTGETPFGGVGRHLVLARQLHEAPPSVRILRPDLSQRVDETLSWALAKDPAARPQTAMGYARALRSASMRSRPLGSLFARAAVASAAVEAPRGVLRLAADLVGKPAHSAPLASPSASPDVSPDVSPDASPAASSSPIGARSAPSTAFTPAFTPAAGATPGRLPIPRRDNGTRPLDKNQPPSSSQPQLVSYDSQPLAAPDAAPPSRALDDAAPTLGPGFVDPGYAPPYASPYGPQYAPPYTPSYHPMGYTDAGRPAWPGTGRPPMAPPPRRPRPHSALKFAAGMLVVILGCVLLLGTLNRTGLFAETSPLAAAQRPTPTFAPTATALPTPTPTVPPDWVHVAPATISLTCKPKGVQTQLTIRNLGNQDLMWHIDASGYTGLQFSKMDGDTAAGRSTSVTVKDVAWWDQQGSFDVVPDTDGAGDPQTVNYSAQGCPWGTGG